MSEQPQKPRRTPLRPDQPQAGYNQPNPPPYNQQPLPAAPPPRYDTPLSMQAPPEQVVIVKREGSNNQAGNILNAITWPFRKIIGAVLWLVRVIIAAMIRSVISFIIGILMMILIVVLVGVYGFALVDTQMNAIQALTLSFDRILLFFQSLGGFQEAAQNFQNSIPTGIPGNP